MDRIDGFLSQKVQRAFPDATVLCLAEATPKETWVLRRPDEDELGLGINFGEAKAAVQALISSVAKGENTIMSVAANAMTIGYEQFAVTRVEQVGSSLHFYSRRGENPIIVKVSSPEQAKDAEAGVRHLMELPPRVQIRLGQVSDVVMGILRRRHLRLHASDGPAMGSHPGIDWSWGAASHMVSPTDKIVWLPDGKFVHALEDQNDPRYVMLDLDFGYKDGTSCARIEDPELRRVVVELLNDRAEGRLMKEVLTWPVPVPPKD